MVIDLSRNAPAFHDRFPSLDAYSRIAQSGEVCSKLGDCVFSFGKYGEHHYLELSSGECLAQFRKGCRSLCTL